MPLQNPMQITDRQAALAGSMIVVMPGLVSVQAQVADRAHQFVWLSHLPPIVLTAGVTWMLIRLLRRYPGLGLFEIMAERRWIGKPLVAAYVLFFFFVLIRDLHILAEFTGIALLQNTPVPVIASLVMMTVVLMGRGGLTPVGRMVELYGTVITITILSLPLLLANDFSWENIRPVMHGDYVGVAAGSWYLLPYFGQVVFLAFVCTNRSLTARSAAVAIVLAASLMLVLALTCLFVLGDRVMSRMAFPNYELVRHIRLTDFMDRLDLVLVGLWMPVMMITMTFTFVTVCLGIKQLMPKRISGKRLTPSVGFLAYAVSFYFFENQIEVYRFNEVQTWLFLPFTIVLPVLFFLVFRPRRRRSA